MPKNGKMMKCLYTTGIIAALLIFGSVAMAYPTLRDGTGIVALPHANTPSSAGFFGAADLLLAQENTVNVRVLYGINKRSMRDTSPFSPFKFNFAGGKSLALAVNFKRSAKIYFSMRF